MQLLQQLTILILPWLLLIEAVIGKQSVVLVLPTESERDIKNRPNWLALTKRIGDSDVVALVANDLARLHRKGWRVGDLVEHLEQRGVTLLLAAPGREIDTSTPLGKIFIQFTAMFDEYYAEDISQRAKDSVAHRKRQGKTIGMAPFGTTRNRDGFLRPSLDGAWLLVETGQFVAGIVDNPPNEKAIWRGYYEAADRVLTLYAAGNIGIEKLAYQMNDEGLAYRDRKSKPRPIEGDDIRRIVSSWAVYGGLPTKGKSKDNAGYEYLDVEKIPFRPDRAVYPIELLKQVARVRQQRSYKPQDLGKKRKTKFYPLAHITRCAHCQGLADQQANPRLQSTLNGVTMNGIRRYRHRSGMTCGCQARSIPTSILEADFQRLIELLYVDPAMLDSMTLFASQFNPTHLKDGVDIEKQKQENIALCRRRIDAAVQLFKDGRMEVDEYKQTVERSEQEIIHWQSYTTEAEKIGLELTMCLEVIEKMSRLWELSDDEDRQGMVRNLFAYIVVDLDKQQIVDFRMKPWAERFLRVRASFFEVDNGGENENASQSNSQHDMPHTASTTRYALN